MTRPHNEARLARLRTDLDILLAQRHGVAEASQRVRESLKAAHAAAIDISGIRWSTAQPVADLIEQLELDFEALKDEPRGRRIAAGIAKAREALAIEAQASRLASEGKRIAGLITPLSELVRACDAWIDSPEA